MTWPDPAEVHETDVDGVRTRWAALPGPLRAGLVFRVGSADETMVTSGVSHFLEHLALYGVGRPGDHSNGQVDQTTMTFHCIGEAPMVVEFLAAVTGQLSDLPGGRLEDERAILKAERAGRRGNVEEALDVWRYGASGYGLAGQGELGLDGLGIHDLRAWSAEVATTGNAVLWLTGPPPAGLELRLPAGEYRTAPDPLPSMLPELPAWFSGPNDGVALSAVLPRGYPNQALTSILRARLVDELRTRRAVAYSPQVDYRPLTGLAGRLLMVSDLVAGRQSDGVRPFLSVLEELSDAGGIGEPELAEWRAAVSRGRSDPQAPLAMLVAGTNQVLLAGSVDSLEEVDAALAAVSAADVATAAQAALATALARVPEGVRVSRAPWRPAPSTLFEPVSSGRTYTALGGTGATLVLSEQGLTHVGGSADRSTVTVPLASTAAVQRWADGRRVLYAADANRLIVEPTLWQDGRTLVAEIDRVWPAQLVVNMGERPVSHIPAPPVEPPAPAADAARPAPPPVQPAVARAMVWVFVALSVLSVIAAVAFDVPLAGVVAAIFGVSAYRQHRQHSEHRQKGPDGQQGNRGRKRR